MTLANTPTLETLPALCLSPTAIRHFIQCPRQYYYKYCLHLPEPEDTTHPMSLGLLIHSLMEVFNRGVANGAPHTATRLQNLAMRLFQWTENENVLDDWEKEGFSLKTLTRLQQLDRVSQDDLARRVMASLEDLERKGYFEQPVCSIHAEHTLSGEIPGIEGCTFHAKLDAMIERSPGVWEIIDYKFYGPHQFDQKKPETREAHLAHVLSPIDPQAATHAERFPATGKQRDYQLPLYYGLSQQDETYRGKVTAVTLQILRPAFPDDPAQGAIPISFPLDSLQENRETFLADLQRFIVDPIRQATVFETNVGRHCQHCAYRWVCDAGDAEGLEGDASL